jgi:non-specific serine/threonine protein kinase
LPVHLDSFVGRRREVAEARRLLEGARLLTLTGPGGAGKTRLATRVAGELERSFPDGAAFVELGELRDPSLVPAVVATTLGLRDLSSRWLIGMLSDYLADARLLLVLDNCEHLVDACAVLVNGLLRTARGLKVLVTSRQPLGVEGEVVLPVPPLSVPPDDGRAAQETLLQYDSVKLFLERAAAVQPGFKVDGRNADAVAELCRSLEGIPLAIELAAVRLRALSVDHIVNRLGDRFRLLSAGSRTASRRHQTLHATVDWSFELLAERERILWRRLAIFADGFELEAAEFVCGGPDLPSEEIFEVLAGLVEKSIVIANPGSQRPRYRMLETIRQYGRRRLEDAGEEPLLRKRHLSWFTRIGEEVEVAWWGPDQAAWFDRLEVDHGNLQAALEFSLQHPDDLEPGAVLATRLWLYWHARGRVGEGRRWLSSLLEGRLPSLARSRTLSVAAYLALLQGDADSALPMLGESLALSQRAGSLPAGGVAVGLLGWLHMLRGEIEEAAQLLDQAVAIHRDEAVEPMSEGLGIYLRALVAFFQEDDRLASQLFERTVAFCRGRGERWLQASALLGLSLLSIRARRGPEALDLGRESVKLAAGLDDRWGTALGVEALAWASIVAGEAERGARLMGGADAVWQTMPAELPPIWQSSHDRYAGEARRRLGGPRFEAAVASGLRLSVAGVVSLAVREGAPGPAKRQEAAQAVTLTRREREIAGLVAAGLSNREISARLVISVRTAETHVENIMSKLGFSSRTQIAAWSATNSGPDA